MRLYGRWAYFRCEWRFNERWKDEQEDNVEEAFSGQGKRTAEQRQIHELELENRLLRMERDILKNPQLCLDRRGLAVSRRGDGPVPKSHCGVVDEPTDDATTGAYRPDYGLVPPQFSQNHDHPL